MTLTQLTFADDAVDSMITAFDHLRGVTVQLTATDDAPAEFSFPVVVLAANDRGLSVIAANPDGSPCARAIADTEPWETIASVEVI